MKTNSLFPLKLPLIKGRPSIPASLAKGAKPGELKTMRDEANTAFRSMARADSFVKSILKQDGREADLDLSSPNVVLVNKTLNDPGERASIQVDAVALSEKSNLEVDYKTPSDHLIYKKNAKGSTYQNYAYPREYHVSKDGKTLTIMDKIP